VVGRVGNERILYSWVPLANVGSRTLTPTGQRKPPGRKNPLSNPKSNTQFLMLGMGNYTWGLIDHVSLAHLDSDSSAGKSIS